MRADLSHHLAGHDRTPALDISQAARTGRYASVEIAWPGRSPHRHTIPTSKYDSDRASGNKRALRTGNGSSHAEVFRENAGEKEVLANPSGEPQCNSSNEHRSVRGSTAPRAGANDGAELSYVADSNSKERYQAVFQS
jgi:hypothetical protein